MIGSIAGLVLIVLGGLAVSAWIRLRRGSGATSDADNSAGPADGTTSGDDGSGWLRQLVGNSSESGTSAEHHAPANVAGSSNSSDAGSSGSGGSSDAGGGRSD